MNSDETKPRIGEASDLTRRSVIGEAGKLVFGAMVLGAMQGKSADAQEQAPGFFELRIYTAVPGKRDALAERFYHSTAAVYARHGITNVGYWIPQQSDDELGI